MKRLLKLPACGAVLFVLIGPALAGDTAKLDATALARKLDQYIQQRLDTEKVKPSPVADDAEFVRRAYLDITGVIPTADKAAAFIDSKDPGKRSKLIDELLGDPKYGRHQADIWATLLFPRTSDNKRLSAAPLHQ